MLDKLLIQWSVSPFPEPNTGLANDSMVCHLIRKTIYKIQGTLLNYQDPYVRYYIKAYLIQIMRCRCRVTEGMIWINAGFLSSPVTRTAQYM